MKTMRYLVEWEIKVENMDKAMQKELKYQELVKNSPEKYPKNVIPVHMVNADTYVTVWDVDNPTQIANKLLYMLPEGKAKLTPILEAGDLMKIMMQSKK
jgi:Lon protease-like protein